MDEIRFIAGPIVQRHLDKLEAERQAKQKEEEDRQARIRAEVEARKKAEDDKKAAAEGPAPVSAPAAAAAESGTAEDPMDTAEPTTKPERADSEMKDAPPAADPDVE